MTSIQPFHLAIPVNDLDKARQFYGQVLECEEGRSTDHWIDFNFFGHQFVTHLSNDFKLNATKNEVDQHHVPVPHFGIIMEWNQWHSFSEMLKRKNIDFIIEPTIRFKERRGEQATMFFNDPFGHALEFKSFKDMSQIFAT